MLSITIKTQFLVLVDADVLTISRGDNISGAYLAAAENIYRRVKSVYMKGKFHTDFKEETLPGWYDQIETDVYLKRNQVISSAICFILYFFEGGKNLHLQIRQPLASGPRSNRESVLALFIQNGETLRRVHSLVRAR